jgi:hypothetical protein
MSVDRDDAAQRAQRARRRQARQIVAEYHEQQLDALLEHVREGLARLDGGEIDVFEVDELIERYQRAARKPWAFCGSSGADWGARRRHAGVHARERRNARLVGRRRAQQALTRTT